tara:strand:- start:2513 stop:2731 length:219 start_codon:yes stop_codon:yes gene_type:complete
MFLFCFNEVWASYACDLIPTDDLIPIVLPPLSGILFVLGIVVKTSLTGDMLVFLKRLFYEFLLMVRLLCSLI